jgi:hypothetical protein
MQKDLDAEAARSAAVVADWQAKVKALEQQIAESTQAVDVATKHRQKHALASSLGDHAAIAAIKAARANQHEAEQRLADLAVALPAAQSALAEAEKVAESARRAVAQAIAEGKCRERVALAGQIDSAIADLTQLLIEFEGLGREISNADTRTNMFGMSSNHDSAIGLRRVRAAFGGKIFDRIFPNAQYDEMKKQSLATAEATHWNLPAAEEVKAA